MALAKKKQSARNEDTYRETDTYDGSDASDEGHHEDANNEDTPHAELHNDTHAGDDEKPINLSAADIAAYYSGSSTQKYLNDIGAYTNLTPAQEVDLATRAKAGDSKALDFLIESNLRLVVSIVKGYQKHIHKGSVTFDDLVQEGNMGLMHATTKFLPELGNRFSTYAVPWINQYVRRSILNTSHTIRIPVHLQNKAHSKLKAKSETNEEAEVIARVGTTVPLDTPIGYDSDGGRYKTLGDIVEDTADTPEVALSTKEARVILMTWIDTLKPREKQIIYARYGIPDGEPKTLAEISEEFGMTKQGINLIQMAAQEKLLKLARFNYIDLRDVL